VTEKQIENKTANKRATKRNRTEQNIKQKQQQHQHHNKSLIIQHEVVASIALAVLGVLTCGLCFSWSMWFHMNSSFFTCAHNI